MNCPNCKTENMQMDEYEITYTCDNCGKIINVIPVSEGFTLEVEDGQREKFIEKLVFVDGITRSGKAMTANIVASLHNVEIWQLDVLHEVMAILVKFGFIKEEVAAAMLRISLDNHAYDISIGRNANFRKCDSSSVYKNDFLKYNCRCMDKHEGNEVLFRVRNSKPYFLFMTHELMAHPRLFLKTWPFAKFIVTQRNPIDIIGAWYRRGLGERTIGTPTSFSISFTSNSFLSPHYEKGLFPWYAKDWPVSFGNIDPLENCIRSVVSIQEKIDLTMSTLEKRYRERVLEIPFKELVINSDKWVNKINSFLGTKKTALTEEVLTRENCPRDIKEFEMQRQENILLIKKNASKELWGLVEKWV